MPHPCFSIFSNFSLSRRGSRTLSSIGKFILIFFGFVFSVQAMEPKVLYVYGWGDYIPPLTLKKFEKETGIKIIYDVLDTAEVLEAKLLTGSSGYDLVITTAWPYMARQVPANLFISLDKTKLTNWHHLDHHMLKRLEEVDPANKFGVPYMWGTAGIGYNLNKIKEIYPTAPIDSLSMLFDPKVVSRFASCGVSLLDEPIDVIPAALSYLGYDPSSDDPDHIEEATQLLIKVRPYISRFNSSRVVNDLATGDLCIAQGWSGDIKLSRRRAIEALTDADIHYTVPKEGTSMWIDMLAIPLEAPHPDNAHIFINFLLRPEIIAEISSTIYYANANKDATKLVAKEVRNDPMIYLPATLMERLYTPRNASDLHERLMTRAMIRIKTGK